MHVATFHKLNEVTEKKSAWETRTIVKDASQVAMPKETIASSKEKIFHIGEQPLLISGGIDCLVRPHAMKQLLLSSWEQRYPLIIKEMESARQIGATGISISIPTLGIMESAMLRTLIEFTNNYYEFIWIVNVGHSPTAVLADALEIFQGKAIVNFSTMERKRLTEVLPIIKDTGANIVIQVLDDSGIPNTTAAKIAISEQCLSTIERLQIPLENVIIDPLTPCLAASPTSISTTLQYMQWLKMVDLRSIAWATNVSLGMQNREDINAAYVSALVAFGIDIVVADPNEERTIQAFHSAVNQFKGE